MSVVNINNEKFKEMITSGGVEIIDVREPFEFEEVRIKNAKLIPMSVVPLKLDEIDWNKKVVFYCRSGARSAMVASQIARLGKEIHNLDGGIGGLIMDGEDELLER